MGSYSERIVVLAAGCSGTKNYTFHAFFVASFSQKN